MPLVAVGEAGDRISVRATSGSRLRASMRMAAVRHRGHTLEAQASVCLIDEGNPRCTAPESWLTDAQFDGVLFACVIFTQWLPESNG